MVVLFALVLLTSGSYSLLAPSSETVPEPSGRGDENIVKKNCATLMHTITSRHFKTVQLMDFQYVHPFKVIVHEDNTLVSGSRRFPGPLFILSPASAHFLD